jgi:anti-sigma regulatory factor (Ser/Thr protein kinase)
MMPGMNGLELVAALQASHPSLPVILMTAHGSEELAADALRAGAASYIPKRHLVRDLVEIIQRVSAASGAVLPPTTKGFAAGETSYELVLDSDPDRISPLIAYLRKEIERTGLCDETELMQFAVALDEALSNAICHGNLEVDSALREESLEAYLKCIHERRTTEPWNLRRTRVRFRLGPAEASCTIRDEGSGFDRSKVPDPTDPSNLERASGRGLLLMQTFSDEVRFNEQGNEVTLVKRASGKG